MSVTAAEAVETATTNGKKGKAIDLAKKDEIELLGFEAFEREGEWFAYKGGDFESLPLGPADSIAALLTLVTIEAGNTFEVPGLADEETIEADDTVIELTEDSKGNAYLPGTAPKVNQQLNDAIGKYHSIKVNRCDLTAAEKAAKDELTAICHIHETLFVADPDNSDSKIYRAGDLIVRLSIKKEEKITTEVAGSE